MGRLHERAAPRYVGARRVDAVFCPRRWSVRPFAVGRVRFAGVRLGLGARLGVRFAGVRRFAAFATRLDGFDRAHARPVAQLHFLHDWNRGVAGSVADAHRCRAQNERRRAG